MENNNGITQHRNILGSVDRVNDDGSVRFRLISRTLDRYSTVFLPDGADLRNFKKNPVWLWAHNHGFAPIRPPIGRVNTRTIDQTKDHLDVDVFFDEENDPFAAMVAEKHRTGFLNASSLGAMIVERSEDTTFKNQKGPTFVKYELLEGSSVPIPGNPQALQQREFGEYIDRLKEFDVTNMDIGYWMRAIGWEDGVVRDAVPKDLYNLGVDSSDLSGDTEDRKIIPYKKFSLAPENTRWSFNAKDANEVLGDPPNWPKFRSVHSWYDEENTETRASYKLPVAKMVDGEVKAVWRGVSAAMGALLGARGGVDIPDGDRRKVYNRLVKYYNDFDKKPPEFRALDGNEIGMLSRIVNNETVSPLDTIEYQDLFREWSDTIKSYDEADEVKKLSFVFNRETAVPELRQHTVFFVERIIEAGSITETETRLLEETKLYIDKLLNIPEKRDEFKEALIEARKSIEAQEPTFENELRNLSDIMKGV